MKKLLIFTALFFTNTFFGAQDAEKIKQDALNKAHALTVDVHDSSMQESLILSGADPNTKLENGTTPLEHYYKKAAVAEDAAISHVSVLLFYGAQKTGWDTYATYLDVNKKIAADLKKIQPPTIRIRQGQEKQDDLNKNLKRAQAHLAKAQQLCDLLKTAGAQDEEHKKDDMPKK